MIYFPIESGVVVVKDRIKALRKQLGLNQTNFGARIGIKQGSVAGYESGARTPMDAVVNSICREFCVEERWLKDGVGPMFVPLDVDSEFEQIWTDIRLSKNENASFIKNLLKAYWSLSEDKKTVIRELIDSVAQK